MDKEIVAIDVGGTYIKYGVWRNNQIEQSSKVKTPATWEEMLAEFVKITAHFVGEFPSITELAMSFPGAVNQEKGIIFGDSAIPYIHEFPIAEEISRATGLHVVMENDAKCAALAELWQGNAQGLTDVALFVIGSEIGGAIITDGKVQHGQNLYSGEFGWMLINEKSETLSLLGSPVQMAKRYCRAVDASENLYTAEDVFNFAEKKDPIALTMIENMYRVLATGLFNISVMLNPELILIGGGISGRPGFVDELQSRVQNLINQKGITDVQLSIMECKFHNTSNMVGAVYNLEHE